MAVENATVYHSMHQLLNGKNKSGTTTITMLLDWLAKYFEGYIFNLHQNISSELQHSWKKNVHVCFIKLISQGDYNNILMCK